MQKNHDIIDKDVDKYYVQHSLHSEVDPTYAYDSWTDTYEIERDKEVMYHEVNYTDEYCNSLAPIVYITTIPVTEHAYDDSQNEKEGAQVLNNSITVRRKVDRTLPSLKITKRSNLFSSKEYKYTKRSIPKSASAGSLDRSQSYIVHINKTCRLYRMATNKKGKKYEKYIGTKEVLDAEIIYHNKYTKNWSVFNGSETVSAENDMGGSSGSSGYYGSTTPIAVDVSGGTPGETVKETYYSWLPVEYTVDGESRTIYKYDTAVNGGIPTKNLGKGGVQRVDAGYQIEMIVDHITAGAQGGDGVTNWWWTGQNGTLKSSTNYVIDREGKIHEVIPLNYIANGNGISSSNYSKVTAEIIKDKIASGNCGSINGFTANIEHTGTSPTDAPGSVVGNLTQEQFDASVWLHKYIINYAKQNYGSTILPNRDYIIGHYEIDPTGRPYCPGPNFPWQQLIEGISKN